MGWALRRLSRRARSQVLASSPAHAPRVPLIWGHPDLGPGWEVGAGLELAAPRTGVPMGPGQGEGRSA